MRVLCLGLDGADYDLVCDLLAEGRLPTLGRLTREGAFGPLRSTIPAFTPTAWSSFLTGLNPGGHGIFSFSTNPNRGVGKVESAASRAGTPLWRLLGAAAIRSAYVTIPFTYPPEPLAGVMVTGFGGPDNPEIYPPAARNAIRTSHPDLVTAKRPHRWLEDFRAFTRGLIEHVDEIADVCLLALELEPDLELLCVDFMSSDIVGHLGWHRLDVSHPAHDAADAGEELVQVYEAVDRACGELIEQAAWLHGEEPTALILSDHGMKPTHWIFRANRWLEEAGYLRYRAGPTASPRHQDLDEARNLGLEVEGAVEAPFAEIEFARTSAYCFGYGGQIYLGEVSGAVEDRGLELELASALAAIPHPETGAQAFDVARKEELYRGDYVDKAPELVLLPRDERIFVDSSRQLWPHTFERNERLDRPGMAAFSGHHGRTGILAAAGPGIHLADLGDAEITQMAATLLALLGVSADLDAPPIDALVDREATPERGFVAIPRTARPDRRVYTDDEEARLAGRLRELGYE